MNNVIINVLINITTLRCSRPDTDLINDSIDVLSTSHLVTGLTLGEVENGLGPKEIEMIVQLS